MMITPIQMVEALFIFSIDRSDRMNCNAFNIPDDFEYILDCLGKEVSINGTSRLAVIGNRTINGSFDDKTISTLTPINRGDLITYGGNQYLIISEVNGTREQTTRYKGMMRRCNYNIKFNFQGFIKKFPTIINTKTAGISEGQYISLPYGTIQVVLQENPDTLEISLNQRFIIIGNPYKVTAIDRSARGLITLTAEITLFNENDDVENEIVDKGQYSWSVEINGDTIAVVVGQSVQLTYTLKLNGNAANDPGFTTRWTVDNPAIASINSGLVNGLEAGNIGVTLNLSAPNNDTIADTVLIDVQTAIQDQYSITINGNAEIPYNSTSTYTTTVYNNGVQVEGQGVTWSVDDGNGNTTDKCHIVSSDNTQCSVKNDQAGNARIKAVLEGDNTVIGVKDIVCKNIW